MNTPESTAAKPVAALDPSSQGDGLRTRDLVWPGPRGDVAARLYTPLGQGRPGQQAGSLIVFFHQGGFVGGNLDEADRFVQSLARKTGLPVLATRYTLASQQPFPAAAEDAHAALCWVHQQHAALGWRGTRLITAGIEAGGNLAAVAALMARDRGTPAVAAQILIMPMLDPGLSTCSMRLLNTGPAVAGVADACAAGYRGYLPRASDRSHPYASPLQSSRLKGLPATLILSAQDDPLRDEAELYGARLIACGTKTLVKRLPAVPLHDGPARCDCARQDSALHEIAAFIAGLPSSASPALHAHEAAAFPAA